MTTQTKQKLKRGAGILMPISALPSPYGIGTLGEQGYRFADFLKRVGCRYWQVLPVGPTSFGDSPYQSFSAFAGNPYFIDLDYLIEEELLLEDDVNQYKWNTSEDTIEYATIYEYRFKVLRTAFTRSNHYKKKSYLAFCEENDYWLDDYSFYMALKSHFNNQEWSRWDDDIKYRKKDAVSKYESLLEDEINFWKFCQYKFRQQWDALKEYTNNLGIQIIGDIPLYVALDSADVWVHGDLFELDERKKPINVAGVPPDAFSADGQRWGNPIYRWDEMENRDFDWWRERMKASASLYDIIRIDHFIGVVNYYSIPEECPTAIMGRWKIGPGRKLTTIIKESIGDAKIIAEDLGVLTPNVKELIIETGYPGMKIIEFGLDGPVENDYLPHNYNTSNIVAYTGTHDNETLVGFLKGKSVRTLKHLCKYFNVSKAEELPETIIRALYSCVADVAIVQMQDLLKLDNSARMNFPSTVGNNWKWRFTLAQYDRIDEEDLYEMACLYGRAPKIDEDEL
ncbi:MAG: malQ [Anaerocolumna sp.]|jgi:4-alpha-glucanotransferase|nr:malQ [Anaerocolumna sp.]